jgi:two-component system NtrC family sensor kinase
MLVKEEINYKVIDESNNVEVYGQKIKFQQIFMNLLSNAKDALETKENKNIEIKLHLDDEYLLLDFSDNGIGIKEDAKDFIFDSFYTSKEVGKGTGLGLSIVFSIIEEMKGSISVTTQVDLGTTFHLKLPLKK